MPEKKTAFGVAMCNFQAYPESPDPGELLAYAERAEELGYESLWVWDHILLGVDPCFPILDALTLLSPVATQMNSIKLGVAAGWYNKREFDAVGVDYRQRGKIMDRNLDVINALLTEDWVKGEYGPHVLHSAHMFPKSVQKPRPPLACGLQAIAPPATQSSIEEEARAAAPRRRRVARRRRSGAHQGLAGHPLPPRGLTRRIQQQLDVEFDAVAAIDDVGHIDGDPRVVGDDTAGLGRSARSRQASDDARPPGRRCR